VIFTAPSLRLIRWKRPGSGTASRPQARRRQSEHKVQREKSRRRTFVTKLQSRQPKGRFAFTRATSVSSTRAALPSRRLRFALFVDNRWRREERALKTLPRAVILKRFATDLRVLLRAMGFGIRRESLIRAGAMTNALLWCVCTGPECFRVHRIEPAGSPKGELAGASESNVLKFVGCNLPHGNSRR
jgi:hypothetical protein